jgi:hypothetical protein
MNSCYPVSPDEARHLCEWLDAHPSEELCHRVLRLMAQCHRDAVADGREGQTLLAKEIAEKLGETMPDPKRPAEWMDWKRLHKYWSVSVETGLLPYLRERDQVTYLAPAKVLSNPDPKGKGKGGRGKQTSYRLTSKALPSPPEEAETGAAADIDAADPAVSDITVVRYKPDSDVVPALWARLFFSGSVIRFTWGRGWLLLACVVVAMLLALTVSVVGYFALTSTTLTVRDLLRIGAVVLAIDLLAWGALQPWWRLMDDRLVPAPEIFVPLKAKSAQLELMVGRCRNSPREHVFSFDRVTHMGGPLRVPPTVAVG